MTDSPNKPLSYSDAGVDIEAGERLVDRIIPHALRTVRPGVLGGLGGFGALFQIPVGAYREPILVSGTDGVGTKLMLATQMGKHDTIGIDLVAMCVNDIVVCGAEPLYFLDYFATGKLDVETAASVVSGIAEGCVQAGAALAGGETAEMPGMYKTEDYDLAGFCTGVVEKDDIIDGHKVCPGDVLVALGSSGPHSNGFSLIRKILERSEDELDTAFGKSTLGDALLEPTRIYVKSILNLAAEVDVHAIAHITGGGLTENIPRVMPGNTKAVIETASWELPDIFKWLQNGGNVEQMEMYRTFNCGVGMVVCVPATELEKTLVTLKDGGENAWVLGYVEAGEGSPVVEYR